MSGCVSTSPSCAPSRSISLAMRSEPNSRIRSSSSDRKNCDAPGSPWRPARPRSWRSMRRDSWRSEPMMWRPPHLLDIDVLAVGVLHRGRLRDSVTPGPSLMSVPRPAMFVAIVTAPGWPAPATISASRWWYLALSTLCTMPARWNSLRERLGRVDARRADQHRDSRGSCSRSRFLDDRVVLLAPRLVDEVVPVVADHRLVGRDDRRPRACRSRRTRVSSVSAVPVMPASLSYMRK